MKRFLTPVVTTVIIAFIVLSACYSLGIFNSGDAAQVMSREYSLGNFTYSGGLRDGLFNGIGTIDFQNGESYTGGFAGGQFDGKGAFTHTGANPDQDWRFDGDFQNGQISEGTFSLAGGRSVVYRACDQAAGCAGSFTGPSWLYVGAVGDSGPTGGGAFTFTDGFSYQGGFADGLADGQGVYTDAAGQIIYTGGFAAGRFAGTGRYCSSEGWTYDGGFLDGLFDGVGVLTRNGVVIHGVWSEGVQAAR